MAKTSEPWPVLFALGALGAGLIFGALAMLWSAGPPGVVLTVLWCVPVSAVLAACTYFARKQNKVGLFRAWGIVELIALLGAASLTVLLK
ncbi:MAG: hypothetical protein ACJ790_01400 [Myxococcaceae bacterium]